MVEKGSSGGEVVINVPSEESSKGVKGSPPNETMDPKQNTRASPTADEPPTVTIKKQFRAYQNLQRLDESSCDEDGKQTAQEITNEEEARSFAYEIFRNVAPPPHYRCIDEDDLLRFLTKEEVDLVLQLFEGSNNGKIDGKSFKNWVVNNEKVYYPNLVLYSKPISNYYRSPEMGETIEFCVDLRTPAETIGRLKKEIKRWHPGHVVVVTEIENDNKLKMALRCTHTMNFQDIGERKKRRSNLIVELRRILEELSIRYITLLENESPEEVARERPDSTNAMLEE
ncbi:hypothetical protein F3Y22_tig00110944pilonHSYRG00062 [Hibiscus syriacus]|uniref:Uncharacterized protein n=1 Tax=Hibiscus syriacus TaxID=106335 RepID=A0A6A2ZDM6_HIBSY|nr:hypothetical protein F3Y22_tig00110944pilonHSYRG00062 [Hibiscus syriacus]